MLCGKNIYMLLPRYLQEAVRQDLEEKMVFVSGPRQVGKTTLAKMMLSGDNDRYLNWDRRQDRKTILSARWPASKSTVVIDELHKYRRWKGWLKGEYDSHGAIIRFLITGSARLDVYRRGGDSLQGRYHRHRLHGFSVGELAQVPCAVSPGEELLFPDTPGNDAVDALMRFGPFPEPFLKQNEKDLRRWQQQRLERFFREDVRDLENVRDLSSIELLADMLVDRIGSPLSLQALREDLEVSHRAVSHWMEILERLYYCFLIRPFTHKSVRSLRKAAKMYLWDWSLVKGEGARFENMVAGHLLKLVHGLKDQEGYGVGLHYLRDASKREVDFLVTVDRKPWFAVECKLSGRSVNPALNYFGARLKIPYLYQLVLSGTEDVMDNRVRIIPAAKFLGALM